MPENTIVDSMAIASIELRHARVGVIRLPRPVLVVCGWPIIGIGQ
jgi:hypothetical protein